MAEPCREEAEATAYCPLPTPPPARISWGACGVQLRMFSLSRHRVFPPPGSAWGAGESPCTVHIPGRREALPGEPGPVPDPKGAASSQQPPRSPPTSSPGRTGFGSHRSETKGF